VTNDYILVVMRVQEFSKGVFAVPRSGQLYEFCW